MERVNESNYKIQRFKKIRNREKLKIVENAFDKVYIHTLTVSGNRKIEIELHLPFRGGEVDGVKDHFDGNIHAIICS